MKRGLNESWTVHDGLFFASHARENRSRAPNERVYQRLKTQKDGDAPSPINRSATLGSMLCPQVSRARALENKPIQDGPAQSVSQELLASVACAFARLGVAHTLPIISGMFACLNLKDPVIAIFMLVFGQQMFAVHRSEYGVEIVLASALSLGIKTVIEERFYVGDLLRECDFLKHLDQEEMVEAECDLFTCVSLDVVRQRFVMFRAASALSASETVECRSSRFEIELRVFFNPGIKASFQEFAMLVFGCAVCTVRMVDIVSNAHMLISDSVRYKEFALNPDWQFLRAPALVVLVEQPVAIPGCVSFTKFPSANALLVCVAHCM